VPRGSGSRSYARPATTQPGRIARVSRLRLTSSRAWQRAPRGLGHFMARSLPVRLYSAPRWQGLLLISGLRSAGTRRDFRLETARPRRPGAAWRMWRRLYSCVVETLESTPELPSSFLDDGICRRVSTSSAQRARCFSTAISVVRRDDHTACRSRTRRPRDGKPWISEHGLAGRTSPGRPRSAAKMSISCNVVDVIRISA